MKPPIRQSRFQSIHGAAREAVLLVSKAYPVCAMDIHSRNKSARVAWPRQIVHWLLCQCGFASTDIGRATLRHHSTILHSRRAVERRRDCYPSAKQDTDKLLNKFTR
jgi:chromosomal replication initiation ATPase DnaA